jgi:hypothetical protein
MGALDSIYSYWIHMIPKGCELNSLCHFMEENVDDHSIGVASGFLMKLRMYILSKMRMMDLSLETKMDLPLS